jgi:hypothetical protein
MADSMSVNQQIINIKATTTEGLGAIGQGDGIAAMCVVLHSTSSNAGNRQLNPSREVPDRWLCVSTTR